ncbi:daunorubicin resistance protein DrrA family ABC transporter ATP-binding protein [Actinosynnema sp. NPDC047251]|uniref:ATPase component of ABC-type multidrug transport system n=1 Tax=Saccharothrix espanaensis (strain ATCC 51144 / DSM 44229 / JCM 9112 / NBRC 15066 / NRRL 15764) TaxID=1179773 RepID=K0JSA9_SACES|nr:daunorubicin resistance protein DrrA family ABC transporter ATP-binding protein [Saccharothrix espanaensis]CCH30555.1 ATPase component of ABC-type multidrug transport system [Saccharothrix espanaensis DSM 44229]
MDLAIEVSGLRKTYDKTEALRGIDLSVRTGSVLGVLGPNGAGKTTAVRVLATLLVPDGGTARVAGFDVVKQPREVRRRIGLAGQNAAVDELLTGRENLVLLGRLLHLGGAGARKRAGELLERFDLVAAGDRPVGTYSGGMRRRLDLASCLVGNPQVLFLDEPTTGLDPASRQSLWNTVRVLVDEGVTVLLTTQYLEEADYLADQIVVIAAGQVIADGTPDELKRKVGQEWLEVAVALPDRVPDALAALGPLAIDEPTADATRGLVKLQLKDGMDGIATAAVALRDAGVDVADFSLRRPTLDDVFFNLVGHPTEK